MPPLLATVSVLLWSHHHEIEIAITSFISRDFSHGDHETSLSLSRKSNTECSLCKEKNKPKKSQTSDFSHASIKCRVEDLMILEFRQVFLPYRILFSFQKAFSNNKT